MMDFSLTTDQLDLRAALTALLAEHSPPSRVRAAEPLGFDPALWAVLGDFGFPQLASGGGEAGPIELAVAAGPIELAVAARAAGVALASAPLIESVVATRLLDRLGRPELGGLITFAPRPAVAGIARTVPWGAVADRVLAWDGNGIVASRTGAAVDAPKQTLSGLALGHVDLAGAAVLVVGPDARRHFAEALADWRVLTAAALAGIGAEGLRLGVDYAKSRQQFGRPIGTFQALAHQLADAATLVDGAELLVLEAAWAIDTGSPRRHGLAAMAAAFAGRAARQATDRGLHAHGGYGYTLEYDIQLYFRRAKALDLLTGGERAAVDATAELALADHDEGRRAKPFDLITSGEQAAVNATAEQAAADATAEQAAVNATTEQAAAEHDEGRAV
ncbi:acyl-CoA dehydrogenase family protein [Dactylosporangium sp. CS-047395]|uniref:acyl-CoA dehydrogenase family protein n=1 Tax=Dactylosporangium sp. CS-047395 TaxID=3239936 RepID=UPI003D9209D9